MIHYLKQLYANPYFKILGLVQELEIHSNMQNQGCNSCTITLIVDTLLPISEVILIHVKKL